MTASGFFASFDDEVAAACAENAARSQPFRPGRRPPSFSRTISEYMNWSSPKARGVKERRAERKARRKKCRAHNNENP